MALGVTKGSNLGFFGQLEAFLAASLLDDPFIVLGGTRTCAKSHSGTYAARNMGAPKVEEQEPESVALLRADCYLQQRIWTRLG